MADSRIKYGLTAQCGTQYGFEEAQALMEVLSTGALADGSQTRAFEREFGTYCGTEHAIAVSSGSAALQLAAVAAGVGPETEVIASPLSDIATVIPFSRLGARIVFCDVDARTYTMNPAKLPGCITEKTRAIIPTHLYGQCADMVAIRAAAGERPVCVIEDAAQNTGGSYKGIRSGAIGDMGIFSFNAQMPLSTLGQGGMLTTHDPAFAEAARHYRTLCPMPDGSVQDCDHLGYNYALTEAQSAVGRIQLKRLDTFIVRRRSLAARLAQALQGTPHIDLPFVDIRGKHIFLYYAVKLTDTAPISQADLIQKLYAQYGIQAQAPGLPVHLTKLYQAYGHAVGECPNAESLANRLVLLPLHPGLSEQAVDYMAQSIRALLT